MSVVGNLPRSYYFKNFSCLSLEEKRRIMIIINNKIAFLKPQVNKYFPTFS